MIPSLCRTIQITVSIAQFERGAITWKDDASFGSVLLEAADVASCNAGSSRESSPALGRLFLDGAAAAAGRAHRATCRSPSDADNAWPPLGLKAIARTGSCTRHQHNYTSRHDNKTLPNQVMKPGLQEC